MKTSEKTLEKQPYIMHLCLHCCFWTRNFSYFKDDFIFEIFEINNCNYKLKYVSTQRIKITKNKTNGKQPGAKL